jgi:hypothetical protein
MSKTFWRNFYGSASTATKSRFRSALGSCQGPRCSRARSAARNLGLNGGQRPELLTHLPLSPAVRAPDTITAESRKLHSARARHVSSCDSKVAAVWRLTHRRDYTASNYSGKRAVSEGCIEWISGPSVWLAVVSNDMEINRVKGLIAIILRRFGHLERAPKFSS